MKTRRNGKEVRGRNVKQKLGDHELCAWDVDKLNFRAEMIKSLGTKKNCLWEKKLRLIN